MMELMRSSPPPPPEAKSSGETYCNFAVAFRGQTSSPSTFLGKPSRSERHQI
ncbi:unnamed protein product [Arabis nemorensis]|uniref:Uncharacterized protein n=1 Tax=Arabis nemorensis TaxID=586526 RepID=A0A565BBZ7_9BRAS|nr:unnamed protein product [Arabis nemorensis]